MKSSIDRDNVLTIAGLAGLAALFIFAVHLPGRRQLARIDAEIAAVIAEVADIPRQMQELDQLRAELLRRERYLDETLVHVPAAGDVHGVLREVAQIARRADLKVSRLEPQSPIPHASYQTIPFRVGFSGEFARIAEFLQALEGLERVVAVHDLTLSVDARRSGQDAQGTLDFHVYVRNSEISDSAEKNDSIGGLASDTNRR